MTSTLRKLRPLATLAMVALIGAGCSNASDRTRTGNDAAANQEQAVKFAECMRDNGVSLRRATCGAES